MRILISILVGLSFFSSTFAQLEGKLVDNMELKGKVKSFTVTSCAFVGVTPLTPDGYHCVKVWTFKYDEKGHEIERISYGIADSITNREVIIYNGEGQVSETDSYDGKNILLAKYTATYSNNGTREEDYAQFGDSSRYLIGVKIIDSNKNLTELISYNKNGKIYSHSKNKYAYKYDAKKKLIESDLLDTSNNVINKEINIYDSLEHLIEQSKFQSNGKLVWTEKYNNGRLVEYDLEEEKGKDCFISDSLSTETETFYNKKGKLQWKKTIKYQFDKEGNWIKAELYKADNKGGYRIRTFEYY